MQRRREENLGKSDHSPSGRNKEVKRVAALKEEETIQPKGGGKEETVGNNRNPTGSPALGEILGGKKRGCFKGGGRNQHKRLPYWTQPFALGCWRQRGNTQACSCREEKTSRKSKRGEKTLDYLRGESWAK